MRITATEVKNSFDKYKPKGFDMDTSKFDSEFAKLLNKAFSEMKLIPLLNKANK